MFNVRSRLFKNQRGPLKSVLGVKVFIHGCTMWLWVSSIPGPLQELE